MTAISRRDALRLAGGLGAVSLLAACTKSPHATFVAPGGSASGSAGPAPTGTAIATPPASPDWTALRTSLDGRLLRPGGSGYTATARLYNPRFDAGARPAAIATCTTPADVAACVRFAADARVPFAIRSGGHSYPGWSTSTGLVIDVSGMSSIAVDTAAQTARIGAGAHLVEVYAALAAHGVGVAGGSCPTVGIAGLTLGGGIGVLSRPWGLACDAVRAVEIVTADGKVQTVDTSHNPDLFWALRGGGGGSFGVVTSFTMTVRPAPTVHTFYLDWHWPAAADVLDAWQHWMPSADTLLTSTCKLLVDPGPGTRTPLVAGTWIGSASSLNAQLAPLLAGLPHPATRVTHTHSYADAMLAEAGCSHQDANTCVSRALAPSKRQPFAATSTMVTGTLPPAAIDEAVARAGAALDVPAIVEGGVSFDSLGGAVADVAGAATAFGHRGATASVQYTATWRDGGASPAPYDKYVRGFRAALATWAGSGAYVNYADQTITDYGTAYWAGNYARLTEVKRTVDPDNLFHFPQSVRPST